MIKKEIYPKTVRIPIEGDQIIITEKLDGSNLYIFKLNNKLYIAQRNAIFDVEKDFDEISYGSNLKEWLTNYKEILLKKLHNGSVICGEWLGMGHIKYTIDKFDKKFYMFAKSNIDEDLELKNIIYYEEYFKYPSNK